MDSGDWIRSPQSKALLWATFVMSLVLGASLVIVDRHRAEAPGRSLTDDQAAAQVVGAALMPLSLLRAARLAVAENKVSIALHPIIVAIGGALIVIGIEPHQYKASKIKP